MSDINLNYSGEQLDEAIGKVLDDYADVSEVDAEAEDVLSGKKFVNSSGDIVEGTIIGTQGPPGEDGKTWYGGSTTPTSEIGVVGDWYLCTSTSDVYEKIDASTWTFRLNIQGIQGEQGDKGDKGNDNVHVGTTPPADETINIWIDPSGEAGLDIVVVDNLTSTSSTAALSAAQGKVLYDLIGDVETLMAAI